MVVVTLSMSACQASVAVDPPPSGPTRVVSVNVAPCQVPERVREVRPWGPSMVSDRDEPSVGYVTRWLPRRTTTACASIRMSHVVPHSVQTRALLPDVSTCHVPEPTGGAAGEKKSEEHQRAHYNLLSM